MRSFTILVIALLAQAASGKITERVTLSCPPGAWLLMGSTCYHVSEEGVSGSSMDSYCHGRNASAAVVQSEAEMEMLKGGVMRTSTYLGINRQSQREHLYQFLLKMDGNTGYTNFHAGEPNSYLGENCVVADASNNFEWKDVPCYDIYPVLCKTPAYMKTLICREDELQMDDTTCFYGSGGYHNWTEALEGCAARGFTLASIHTERENDAFATQVKGPTPWMGLNDAIAEGDYHWSDGTPMDFVNWRPERPHGDDPDVKDCGYFHSPTGQWGTANCFGTLLGYLCRGPPSVFREYLV